MAHVFHSEKKSLTSLIPQNNFSEKEYESNVVTPIKLKNNNNILESPKPPFIPYVDRKRIVEDSPGPGSYDISEGYYNKHRQFSSKQSYSIPAEYEYLNLPLLRNKEVINDNPGPGQYNPSDKDLFGGKFKKNKNLLLRKDNSLSNSSNSVHSIIKQRNNTYKDYSKDLNNLIICSERRKKENEKNENEINIELNDCGVPIDNFTPNKNQYPSSVYSYESENKKIKHNLGKNKNFSKITGLTLDTEGTSLDSSKISHSQMRIKSSKYLEIKYQINKNSHNNYPSKLLISSTENNIYNNINISSPVSMKNKSNLYKDFKYPDKPLYKREQELDTFSQNMKEFDEIMNSDYLQSPGPGYYDPKDLSSQQYHKPSQNINFYKNFRGQRVSSLRKSYEMKTITPGPGEYDDSHNTIENRLNTNLSKKMRDILFDVQKIAKLRNKREKEARERNKEIRLLKSICDTKEKAKNNLEEIYKEDPLEYRNVHASNDLLFNFGSNDKRFKYLVKNDSPGPGKYNLNLYNSIEKKSANLTKVPSFKELLFKMENKNSLNERYSLNKDLVNNPAVGQYNPDIVSSIKYQNIVKSSFNNYKSNLVLKKGQMKEKKLLDLLKPGSYYYIEKNYNNL